MYLGSFYYSSSEVFQAIGQGEARTTSVGSHRLWLSPVSIVHLLFQDTYFSGLESGHSLFCPKVIMQMSGVRPSISESWRPWQHPHK